jgi:hypothetical protein
MSRHAQRHWLNIQSQNAIERAMQLPDKTVEDEVQHLTEMVDYGHLYEDPMITFRIYRHVALMDAAKALEKAALLHREIVSRGGKP